MRWTKRQPWPMAKALLTGKSLQIFRSPEIVREKFYSEQTPEVELLRYAALLQDESQRITLDASFSSPSPPETRHHAGSGSRRRSVMGASR